MHARLRWPSGQEERVRKSIKTVAVVSGMVAVLALGGCGGAPDPTAMTADLERDLQMATADVRPRTAVVSAIEGGPSGAPSGNQVGRRDAVATPRRSARPRPSAPITETVTSESVSETPAPALVTTERVEPTPAPSPEPTPEPTPEPGVQAPPDLSTEAVATSGPSARGDEEAGRDRGTASGNAGNGDGGRRGGGWGGIIGVVIRGASAGVDHCEEHDQRRNGGRIGTRVGGNGGIIGTVIGEAIDRGRAPVGTPQRWPRY
ncbi:hypothetical protein [Gemmatimonas sp.]|uniref:hypothetical protein n=1 Tax=Gemmatimonas sp. TaxID=1962908 RepID=UPI0037BF9BC4